MFGISPEKLLVLLAVGVVLLGPEKMPEMARDAARMLRTLRDLAHGARSQLTSELGPEFANFDFTSLNPRTAIRNALLSEDTDFLRLNPKEASQNTVRGGETAAQPQFAAAPARTAQLDSDAT